MSEPGKARLYKWLAIIGVCLIPLSAYYYFHERQWFRTRTWVPLDSPISLKPGHFHSPEFEVNFPESFTVLLQTDRKIPRREQESLLGVGYPSTKPHGIRLAWTASDEIGNVQQGGSGELRGGGFSQEHIDLLMGFIKVDKPGRYRLDVDVMDDGGRLATCNPHIKVKLDGTRGLTYALEDMTNGVLCLLLASFGAGVAVISWRSYRQLANQLLLQ